MTRNPLKPYDVAQNKFYGLFTLNGNGTGTARENITGTIGNNGFSFLSLSQTSVNISTWYYTFHLVPESVAAPAPCSVNIPLLYASCAYFIEAASSEVVSDDGESIRGSLQLVVEVIV